MRKIGQLENEEQARTFSDYLYVRGLENQLEQEPDSGWSVWIVSEDDVEQARHLLSRYRSMSGAQEFAQASADAALKRKQDARQEAQAKKQERRIILPAHQALVTMLLVLTSIMVGVFSQLGQNEYFIRLLSISNFPATGPGFLLEVRHGQLWRLLSPIFLHFDFFHILFNLLWLYDLGSLLESRLGSLRLMLMVVVLAVLSNLGQYMLASPHFGGMSGVVYGLLGYTWIRGRYDPGSDLYLHPTTVLMMLIWFIMGWTMNMGVANLVHTIGLGLGMAWGYLAAKVRT